MASALTAFPEDGDFSRIWYDRLCIEFNSDGGLSPAELRVIRLSCGLSGCCCGAITAGRLLPSVFAASKPFLPRKARLSGASASGMMQPCCRP